MDTRTTVFSFLTAGPEFSVAIPSQLTEDPPQLSTPVNVGSGGRSLTFLPRWADAPLGEAAFVGLTEQEAEIYERTITPPMRWLRWPLDAGAIYTHLYEDDWDLLSTVSAAITPVADPDGGAPFVLLSPPVTFAGSGRVGWQEEALLVSTTTTLSISLRRPSFLSAGRVVSSATDADAGFVIFRGGTEQGVEIQVAGTDEDDCGTVLDILMHSLTAA